MAHVCGIAGFDRRLINDPTIVRRLQAGLRHRGPDGAGSGTAGPWQLVQTRLAVIDLSDRVRYPMTNEAGDVHLVFNGEIYGHGALRAELEARGHVFRTRCDAEVVVHGWEEWGPGLFPRLNGMFALGVVDDRTGELILARDRLGIKPLVRTLTEPFAFASDALELVAAGLVSADVDVRAIDEYLAFHYVPSPLTGLLHVAQVEPGTMIRRRRDGTEHVDRWSPYLFEPRDVSTASLEEAEDVLRTAVRRQIVADVDVGVFLSSGIDSALILSYAVEAGARPTALTIGFRGHGDYDESVGARQLTRGLGVRHVVESFDLPFDEVMDQVGRAYDLPFADPSSVATLQLARMAREHVTVALSGTGGDDLFGGYYRHRAHHLNAVLDRVPEALARRVGPGPPRGGERSTRVRLARSYLARLAATVPLGARGRYLALIGSSTSDAAARVVRGANPDRDAKDGVAERHGFNARVTEGVVDLDALQAFEMRTYLPGDLLLKEDRATMLFSVEARVPLLDQAVLDLSQRVAVEQRASRRQGKRLLREIASRRLPNASVQSGKRGFAVPLAELFRTTWREPAYRWLNEVESELVDGPKAAALGDAEASGLDRWALCALAAWDAKRRDSIRRSRVRSAR